MYYIYRNREKREEKGGEKVKGKVERSRTLAMEFEFNETTISYDYESQEVHVYTTLSEVARSLLKGPKPPFRYKHLQPGYELSYRLSECLEPIDLIRTEKNA